MNCLPTDIKEYPSPHRDVNYRRRRVESGPAIAGIRQLQTYDIDEGNRAPSPEPETHDEMNAMVDDDHERDICRPFSVLAASKQYRQVMNVVRRVSLENPCLPAVVLRLCGCTENIDRSVEKTQNEKGTQFTGLG